MRKIKFRAWHMDEKCYYCDQTAGLIMVYCPICLLNFPEITNLKKIELHIENVNKSKNNQYICINKPLMIELKNILITYPQRAKAGSFLSGFLSAFLFEDF